MTAPLASMAVAVAYLVLLIVSGGGGWVGGGAASWTGSSSSGGSSFLTVAAAFSSSPSLLTKEMILRHRHPSTRSRRSRSGGTTTPSSTRAAGVRPRRRPSRRPEGAHRGSVEHSSSSSNGLTYYCGAEPGFFSAGDGCGGAHGGGRRRRRRRVTMCRASPSSSGDEPKGGGGGGGGGAGDKKKGRPSGVYSRPSAAIERGSGFYVPGLEGSRVRALFGAVVLALCRANHVLSEDVVAGGAGGGNGNMAVSEGLAYGFGGLLLLQALVELGKEAGLSSPGPGGIPAAGVTKEDSSSLSVESESGGGGSSSTSSRSLERIVSPSLAGSTAAAEAIQWAAASYVALTPATHFLLVEDDGVGDRGEILFGLGDFGGGGGDLLARGEGSGAAVASAVRTASESRGGRVSVPSTHPAAVGLLPADGRRCVLLQRVDDGDDGDGSGEGGRRRRRCIVVGSEQLLPAFTKGDLAFLGCLGRYVELTVPTGEGLLAEEG